MSRIDLVTPDELRRMHDTEGIIFTGCGGDLNEWIEGVNHMFTEEEILLNGGTFSRVSAFKHDNSTNLLFHFTEDVDINLGRLAIWRIATSRHWNAKWLSDYVDNYLGGFEGEEMGGLDDSFDIQ